jgi:hypothetical protein
MKRRVKVEVEKMLKSEKNKTKKVTLIPQIQNFGTME